MSASESHELRVLSVSSSLPRVSPEEERARSTGFEDVVPPENAAQDLRPSRQYQTLLLLSGFVMIFQTIGIGQAYGIFQEFYTSPQSNIKDAPGQDALVSLVGSIGNGLTWSGSIFVGPLISRVKDPRYITLTGAVVMSLAIVLASFGSRLWHLFLTQSLLFGIGSSMLYFPILSSIPQFFDRHRGFAMGFILSGNGVGGLILAPLLHVMLERVGIRWTLRALGVWNLVVTVPVACVARRPPGIGIGTAGPRPRTNAAIFRKGTFLLQSTGAFLQAAGNVIPLYYLTTYSISVLHYPSSTGSLLLAVNNAVNAAARVAMGMLADYVGRQNTMIASVILSALTVFAFWIDASRGRFLAFVVFYGVYAGGYNALLPTTITEVYGMQNYAYVNTAMYFIRGLGVIFGAPIAGVILGSHARGSAMMSMDILKDRYDWVAVYVGVLLLGASLCVAYVRWLDAKNKGGWSWIA